MLVSIFKGEFFVVFGFLRDDFYALLSEFTLFARELKIEFRSWFFLNKAIDLCFCLSRETFDFPTVYISDEATSLETFRPEHVTLENYESHKTIKAKLAPVGGAKSEEWDEHMKEQGNT